MDYNGESTILYDCLEQDEYILWEGKPGKGNLFSAGVEMGRVKYLKIHSVLGLKRGE